MLQQSVGIQSPTSIGNGQYTLSLHFQSSAMAKFANVGDHLTDSAGNTYAVVSLASTPFSSGGQMTVEYVTQDVTPVQDGGYNSTFKTPGQVDLRPAMQTAGSITSPTLYSAPDYEYQLSGGWSSSSQANLAEVGDRIVDSQGREFEISFLAAGRFSSPFRVREVEKIGVAPTTGVATLYRPTSTRKFFQGTELTDPARTRILNRDKVIIDLFLGQGGGGEGGDSNGDFITEYHTITAGEATAKAFTLSNMPADPTEVLVDVINGGPQEPGTDYTLNDSTFSWDGMGLDGVLEAGDRIRFIYFT